MKYNLIFGGIEQTQEYEEALLNFMQTELGIDDANSINLQNVHRLSKRNDGKPQNIIAVSNCCCCYMGAAMFILLRGVSPYLLESLFFLLLDLRDVRVI
jgi:hypothetical protein